MNGFLGKVARLAVSKAAAFSYAVAVGLAGNLIFHFVQPRDPGPTVIAVPPAITQPAGNEKSAPTTSAIAMPKPPSGAESNAAPAPVMSVPATLPLPPAPQPTPAAIPVPPPKPTPVLQLPERPTASLPDPASTPAPAWKPAPLPSLPGPAEAAAKPEVSPDTDSPAATAPGTAALPPLGPAIEVGKLPLPPEKVEPPPVQAAVSPSAAADPTPPRSLEFSDIWHPYRAVKKGLNWAGDQVSVIGSDNSEARSTEPPPPIPAPTPVSAAKPPRPAEPISLLPTKQKPELADAPAPPAKLPAPGPGSGGLY